MATISDISSVPYSGDLRADALLDETVPNWNYLLPTRTVLYYTFDCSPGSAIDQVTSELLTAFNATQKAAAASILSYVCSLTGLSFLETASGASADFHFGAINISGASTSGLCRSTSGYSYTSGEVLTSYTAEAYIYLDNVEFASSNANPSAGSSGYETLLHEIGHALGLSHPFDGTYKLPAAQDNTNNTVMSYTRAGGSKSTFQSYDQLALTWIYGNDGLGGSYGYNSTNGPSLTLGTGTNTAGTSGNDTFSGTNNNDVFDGGSGIDTVVFSGTRASHTLTKTSTGWTVSSSADGTDTLTNIERLQFADKVVGLDINGTAGQVYRLYQAAFNRTPDSGGLGDWIYGMDHDGVSLLGVSTGFINSPEFASVYGTNPTNSEIVTRFYQNVLHRAPEQAGYDYWMNQIQSGLQTRTQVLTGFSESPENQVQVIGVIQNGIEYTPHQV